MKILCITHADFEGPGVIEQWAVDNNYAFTVVRPYQGEAIPDNFDLLVIMGGPQSATRLEDYSYLVKEAQAAQQAIEQDKPVIGFCLGSQIISYAMGARAERSPEKEVGVFPIQLTHEGRVDPLLKGLPESFPVIHWHNDMPGLTEDSVVLATSPGCPRQIVRYKANVYGFQCHLEIELEGIRDLIAAAPEDLEPSAYTQSEEALLQQDYQGINRMMVELLDRFAAI